MIDIFKAARADKVTWVFHVDSQPQPKEAWNDMAHYYPGDEHIDWIGVMCLWSIWRLLEFIYVHSHGSIPTTNWFHLAA
ncbi:MAG: hypothetical protein R3B54_06850 [Bdellovibrionota bacterium]